jgi:OPT family small oligopeptide transporter
MGYGLAGLSRNFLVYPASAIWPSNLATIALNNSFYTETSTLTNGWKVSQLRFFLYAFAGMFVYFWFPNYIAVFLSAFSWMSWIAPSNIKLAAITGSQSGMGFNPLPTLDWNVVITTTRPLISPFSSTVNNFMGMLLAFPIIVAIWFTNTWYTSYMPISINKPFDRFGARYNVTSIIDENGVFNKTSYEAYSPLYLSASNAFTCGAYLAIYPASVVYVYLYHRREIRAGFRSLLKKNKENAPRFDIHNRLMEAYNEVPEWWFAVLLVFALTLGLIALLAYPTHVAVGSPLMGLLLAILFVIPIGLVFQFSFHMILMIFGPAALYTLSRTC